MKNHKLIKTLTRECKETLNNVKKFVKELGEDQDVIDVERDWDRIEEHLAKTAVKETLVVVKAGHHENLY